jgi:hypothetical protein
MTAVGGGASGISANRKRWFTCWYPHPEPVRKAGPYPDPYQRKLSPEAKGDLRAVVLSQRRLELYAPRPATQPGQLAN